MLELQIDFTKSGNITQASAKTLRDMGMKWCAEHQQALSISEFFKSGNRCKIHDAARSKKYKKEHPNKNSGYQKKCISGNGRFSTAQARAESTNHSWTITGEQYYSLISSPCDYCGLELHERGIGLDRLDNTRDYELGNVVPCCVECNVARHDLFTPSEMKLFIGPAIRAAKLAR